MGAQIRSDLASHSIMPYIFWILNAGTPPSPPTYIHPLLELSWVLSQGSLPEKEHIILRFYCYTNWNYICRLGITLRCLPHAVLLRCLAVRPVLLRQGLHQSPEGDSIFFFFGGQVKLLCSLKRSWTILASWASTLTCCQICQFYLAHATPWQQQASAPPEAQKSTWHPTSAPHHTAETPEDKQFYNYCTRSYKNSG